jgi:parallel beta-helix repeat protein
MSRFGFTAAALFAVAVGYTAPAESQTLSCSASNVRCVGGSGSEYSSIQSAVSAAVAGDTVLVADGSYTGFEVSRSGTSSAPITVRAAGNGAIISTPGSTSDGVSLKNVSYVTIDGFDIRNMSSGRCINGHDSSPTNPMRGLTVRNNKCAGAGREGFYLSEVSNSLVENNSITGSGANGQGRGHGLYLANAGSDNTVIRGNTIYNITGSEGAGMHFNGDLSIGGDGIISGVVVERNTFYGVSFNAISMDGVQNSTIQNNLMYNIGKNAIRAFQIDGADGPQNLRIVNNTFILSNGWGFKASEDGGGHVVFNNIMIASGSGGGSICVENSNITSNYNAMSNRFSRNGESSILTFDSWKSGGDDANSFQGSSSTLFVSSSDYHRKDGGPAVDAGVSSLSSVSAPNVDRDAKGRPQGGGYDLGAFETSTSGSTTPPAPAPAAPTNLRILR